MGRARRALCGISLSTVEEEEDDEGEGEEGWGCVEGMKEGQDQFIGETVSSNF